MIYGETLASNAPLILLHHRTLRVLIIPGRIDLDPILYAATHD